MTEVPEGQIPRDEAFWRTYRAVQAERETVMRRAEVILRCKQHGHAFSSSEGRCVNRDVPYGEALQSMGSVARGDSWVLDSPVFSWILTQRNLDDRPVRVTATYTGQRVNHAAIQHVFRDEDGPVGQDLDDMSRRVLNAARRGVGVRSSTLLLTIRRGSHTQGPRGPQRDVIAGKTGLTRYLGFHLRGTEPHIIRPRRRRTLRFTSGGVVVFARRVQHPGTRANPFLTRALKVR